MDIITQAVLGAAVAEAGWRKDLGRGAIVAGVFFGLMPDFDIISKLWGEWAALVHHRGFTHSIFFAPLVAPLGGYIAWRLSGKKERARSWMHLVFWALLTHPLLDVFTTYGTQLLTPLSDRRFALDGISIIDPLYTVPLMVALLLAFIWRKKSAKRGQRAARLALALTTAYLGLGYVMSRSAIEAGRSQLDAERVAVQRVEAKPTLANIVLWRVIARDAEGGVRAGLYSTAFKNQIEFVRKAPLESELVARAMRDHRAQLLEWSAQGWVGYRVDREDANTVLFLDDLRYGGVRRPLEPLWGAKVTFDAEEESVLDVERVTYERSRGAEMRKEMSDLWTSLTDEVVTPTTENDGEQVPEANR